MRQSLAIAALIATVALAACSSNETNDDEPVADDSPEADARRALLASLATNVVLPAYREFGDATLTLAIAAEAYAADLSPDNLTAAQDAWRSAMAAWQRTEVMQFGPAGRMSEVLGGEDLRDQIYSWPLVNPCRVDQEIVFGDYADRDAFAEKPVNVRGLDAIEYLLFFGEPVNDCAANSSINMDGSWDAVAASDLAQRRADYAVTVARDIERHADHLQTLWEPTGADFVAALATAGDGSETYSTSRAALNAVSDAMFYLDKETKDMKLGIPPGITGCAEATCPDDLEARWSSGSAANILNNLRGFESLYLGGEGNGFDDLLVSIGADDLDTSMRSAITDAIAALEPFGDDLGDDIDTNLQSVIDAYDAIKAITDLLKTQFVTVLDLDLPQRAEGDND